MGGLMQFDEKERREYDLRYNLLVSIQYEIAMYQSLIFKQYQENQKSKNIADFVLLSELQAKLTGYETSVLRQIYHDISLRLEGKLNEG